MPTADPQSDARDAVETMMRRHGGTLYGLGLQVCGSPEDAEEMVQQTFLNAYRSWDSFEGRAKPTTWLYTIARRVCTRMRRPRAGEPAHLETLEELLPRGEATVADAAALDPYRERLAGEARETVERGLAALPLDFRLALVLVDVAELSIGEAADVLGVQPATVKTRVHRARLKLRQALDPTLPQKPVPPAPPVEQAQVCLSMLEAKQRALDREVEFPYADAALCERCRGVFAALDLGQEACRAVGRGELPATLRERLRGLLDG